MVHAVCRFLIASFLQTVPPVKPCLFVPHEPHIALKRMVSIVLSVFLGKSFHLRHVVFVSSERYVVQRLVFLVRLR